MIDLGFMLEPWFIAIAALIFAIIIILIFKRIVKRPRNHSNSTCNHKWKYAGCIVLEDKYPRIVDICQKCGMSVHTPIYSPTQLKRMEEKIR